MADRRLRNMLAAGDFVVAPGVFDHLSLMLAQKVGFPALYASGFWGVASRLGLPDAGIATYTDFLNQFSGFVSASEVPVIADADTGFGGLLNVAHTVRGYEAAGVAAIQIEDQEFPKKCGHTAHRIVVPADEMAQRIAVAVDTRQSDDFLVIARTDARSALGIDAAIERMQCYAEAGADILFLESPQSAAEMRQFCKSVDKPCLANMSNGGFSPMLTVSELRELGYAMAIFPAVAPLTALAAMERCYTHLRDRGDGSAGADPLYDFNRLCTDIGFGDVHAFEKKWGRYE